MVRTGARRCVQGEAVERSAQRLVVRERARRRRREPAEPLRGDDVWRGSRPGLPESGLHKAIGYMVNMWLGLVLFLDDPEIPLDNNGTERAARAPVIGRMNHYGSHSLRGTEVAATFYSLVESAKLNGLEPRFYLRVATRAGLRRETVPLPHEVKAMLAAGKLDPNDFEDHTEEIVRAALAAARAAPAADPADVADLTGR
ncbi:IS66 family transposase [Sorangium sp. So ce117]|uniref:IS66 family transposase n=1 Tax=Sorangium sp. So ce117 TaxID=3133277 RepID=UPI003F62C9A1